jgi:hypothetical protein
MESVRGKFTIVPIMVGSLSPSLEAKYGKILAKYLEVRRFSGLLELEPRNLLEIWRRSDLKGQGLGIEFNFYG